MAARSTGLPRQLRRTHSRTFFSRGPVFTIKFQYLKGIKLKFSVKMSGLSV
jgi:hypothetical protein